MTATLSRLRRPPGSCFVIRCITAVFVAHIYIYMCIYLLYTYGVILGFLPRVRGDRFRRAHERAGPPLPRMNFVFFFFFLREFTGKKIHLAPRKYCCVLAKDEFRKRTNSRKVFLFEKRSGIRIIRFNENVKNLN